MNPAWRRVISYELILQCSEDAQLLFGITSKIELQQGPKHGLHVSLYSQPSAWGKKGSGEGGCAVLFWSCVVPQMAELLCLCWPLVNSLGPLGSSLQFGSRCQASGFGTSCCFLAEAIVWSKSQ